MNLTVPHLIMVALMINSQTTAKYHLSNHWLKLDGGLLLNQIAKVKPKDSFQN